MASSSDTSTIRVTRRSDRSIPSTILQNVLRLIRGKLYSIPTVSPGSIQLTPPTLANCIVEERQLLNVFIYDVSLQNPPVPQCLRRIYYIAGGSWQMPPGKQHWPSWARLVQELDNTKVSVISMPLAQHTPAPKVWHHLLELYAALMQMSSDAGEKVIWAGDSSGGNLVLSLTIDALKNVSGIKAPDAVMAICPSVDLTRGNPDIQAVDKVDPILTIPSIHQSAAAWAGDWDKKDPRISPLFADLSVLKAKGVKVHGVTAGYDLIGPDGLLFRKKCDEAGIEGEWLEWDRQMHVFPLTWMFLYEGQEGFRWIIDVLSRV